MKRNQKIAAVATSLLAALAVLWAHAQAPRQGAAVRPDAGSRAMRGDVAMATTPIGGMLISVRYRSDLDWK